ncbi:MAG: cytochrome c [Candidatus Acidiferrales bacterium]
MKNTKYLGAVVYGMAALAAVAVALGIAPAGNAGDAAAGKTVYNNKCQICHGANGEGATGYAKAMGLQPARLSSDQVQKKTDAELKKIIEEGSGKMKPVKGLSEIDIANVIAYVRTLAKK